MSKNDINIIIDRISTAASVASDEDGAHGAALHGSHYYPEREAQSHSGSSEHPSDVYPELGWPSELPDREEVHRSQAVSRSTSRHPRTVDTSRSSSSRGPPSRRYTGQARESPNYSPRNPPASPPPESVDSAEDYWREQPRPAPAQRPSYYDPRVQAQQYPHSSSSGASAYAPPWTPPGAHSGQIMPYTGAIPSPAPYGQPYPGMPPPPQAYPPSHHYPQSHHSYPHSISHHPGSHIGSPYAPSPYMGSQPVMPYAAPPSGYFPPQYQQSYPQQYMEHWRMQPPPQQAISPPPPAPAAPAPAAVAPTAPPTPAPPPTDLGDDLVKRVEAMLLQEKEERKAKDEAREAEIIKATKDAAERVDRAAKDAADKADRAASDARIAAEAREAERKKIAQEAADQAERAASDAKIAAEAREAERRRMLQEAADQAAKAATDAKAAEEAAKAEKATEAKIKKAEDETAKAKKEAEAAIKKAAEPVKAPTEKKPPIRFHDAVGRKFNFPFHLCAKWTSMEELIKQAFEHVDEIGPHVQSGHYDLMGPDGGIIIPSAWETTIEPDWKITMHMWPLPEKKEEEIDMLPPLDGDILNLDDLLNPPPAEKAKKGLGKPAKRSNPGGFGAWMLGGKPKGKQALKDDKKPDSVAGSQHTASHDHVACRVM